MADEGWVGAVVVGLVDDLPLVHGVVVALTRSKRTDIFNRVKGSNVHLVLVKLWIMGVIKNTSTEEHFVRKYFLYNILT